MFYKYYTFFNPGTIVTSMLSVQLGNTFDFIEKKEKELNNVQREKNEGEGLDHLPS